MFCTSITYVRISVPYQFPVPIEILQPVELRPVGSEESHANRPSTWFSRQRGAFGFGER
jgi:hypothetical protein